MGGGYWELKPGENGPEAGDLETDDERIDTDDVTELLPSSLTASSSFSHVDMLSLSDATSSTVTSDNASIFDPLVSVASKLPQMLFPPKMHEGR